MQEDIFNWDYCITNMKPAAHGQRTLLWNFCHMKVWQTEQALCVLALPMRCPLDNIARVVVSYVTNLGLDPQSELTRPDVLNLSVFYKG